MGESRTTPGSICARYNGLRPFSWMLRTCSCVTSCPTKALSVCTVFAFASTLTLVPISPTLSAASTLRPMAASHPNACGSEGLESGGLHDYGVGAWPHIRNGVLATVVGGHGVGDACGLVAKRDLRIGHKGAAGSVMAPVTDELSD